MIEDFALVQAHYPFAFPLAALVLGALVGSFLNVVVYRLPIMLNREWQQQAIAIIDESVNDPTVAQNLRKHLPRSTEKFNLLFPGSRCPSCGSAIKPWHNIPVVGYFLIGGKCANCEANISLRYPIVEGATALLTMTVVMAFGPTLSGAALIVLTWALIALALIDYDTQLLPDDITLPLLWLGLVANFFGLVTPFGNAFLGACLGYLVLWVVFQLFKLVTGKEGMGYGDFKMLAMLGAWLGVQSLPLIIILSSFAGAVIGGAMIAFGRDRAKPIKFGPFLAIAGWIAMMWGDQILARYLALTTV